MDTEEVPPIVENNAEALMNTSKEESLLKDDPLLPEVNTEENPLSLSSVENPELVASISTELSDSLLNCEDTLALLNEPKESQEESIIENETEAVVEETKAEKLNLEETITSPVLEDLTQLANDKEPEKTELVLENDKESEKTEPVLENDKESEKTELVIENEKELEKPDLLLPNDKDAETTVVSDDKTELQPETPEKIAEDEALKEIEESDKHEEIEEELMDIGEASKESEPIEIDDFEEKEKPTEEDNDREKEIEYVELGEVMEEDDSINKEKDNLDPQAVENTLDTSTLINSTEEENPLLVGDTDKEENEPNDKNPLLVADTDKEENESTDKDTSNKDDLIFGPDRIHFMDESPEGADEELCIIPDTERIISQAEKEAASSIPPLRDLVEASVSKDSDETKESTVPIQETPTKKFIISKYNMDIFQTCRQCVLKRKVKYIVSKDESIEYLCNDNCLNNFKSANVDNFHLNCEKEIRVKDLTTRMEKEPELKVNFERKCVVCQKKTDDEDNNLTWEIMDFCNEFCLSKYQKEIGGKCSSCNSDVHSNSLGKYCVRFGNDIRQFCTSHCLEEYKKGLKVCSYCQQDMSSECDGFLAPVGDKGQFKDFCSQICMEKYDVMTNKRPPKVPEGTHCSVCKIEKTIIIEYESNGTQNYFCSDRCFVAFSFVNNISPGKCSMCRRYFSNEVLQKNTMFYDNVQYSFCSNSCQNIYIIAHRKIVPCAWCKVKKYNFDMMRRYFKAGQVLNMCSINCLSLFQVSVNAVNSKKTECHFCLKNHQPMYHLTMSDATIRNFCSYGCVMSFQNKFRNPITLATSEEQPVPTGEPKKNQKFAPESKSAAKSASPPLPVISSVQSLAKNGTSNKSTPRGNRKTNTATQHVMSNVEIPVKIKHHIIIKPTAPPEQRNVGTMCKVQLQNKGTTVKAATREKGCQTEHREAERVLVPIPIPIYIPSPLPMYSIPVPYPVAFPIPIPVPIFIPTTRNSAKGIMKEIKKIQVKIPTDPYEAELLMMAEMVAGDKKEEHTDSESDVDDTGAPDEGSFSPEPVDASNTFGDDMLQMALKMATELEEPAVDLEGALTANTITAPQGADGNAEDPEDTQPLIHIAERPSCRGRKRGSRGGKQSGKRRRMSQQVELPVLPTQPVVPAEPAEKPDAHLCLKYTFGVNAWKQWVTTKNAELEKSTKYVKPFKTEILQLTSDELNFSLCLFVKEVRKPNGAEYAPDTIYYLCLGIQQYLFENNRIDNIFCDPYYEQFTDSLDEVARKFSVLYNDSHYIVTRVEEEHLWESKQLGAHSPHVLLSTLMFFNTKHFNLTTVQEHTQLSFSHIMKHWKRNPNLTGAARTPGSRNVLLRFYPPQAAMQNNTRKKKVYEQQENDENPLRCPVKLYEFYLSKCPESVKTRNDVFYLLPERSCVPDSPVWYSTTALPQDALEKMLHRVKMVKEINVALLTS